MIKLYHNRERCDPSVDQVIRVPTPCSSHFARKEIFREYLYKNLSGHYDKLATTLVIVSGKKSSTDEFTTSLV